MFLSHFPYKLKRALEAAYTDGISRILRWEYEGEKCVGTFADGREVLEFEVSSAGISYWPTRRVGRSDSASDTADRCEKGRGCGRGCIARNKICRLTSPRIRALAKATLRSTVEEVILQEHQVRIARRLQTQRGLLVYHGLGSGKTITAINAAEDYGGAVVVVPASLQENFKKEVVKLGAKGQYDVYSYEMFTSRKPDVAGRMLILDEAHRIRNTATARYKAVAEQAGGAEKVLLLTGTPMQNRPDEIAPLINLAAGEDVLPVSQKAFEKRYTEKVVEKTKAAGWFQPATFEVVKKPKNLNEFEAKTVPFVDYYHPAQAHFPSVISETVEIEMSPTQDKAYRAWFGNVNAATRKKMRDGLPLDKQEAGDLNAFINAQRQIANTPQAFQRTKEQEAAPKIKAIADRVEQSEGPALIYSNYLASGGTAMTDELKRRRISYGELTGSMSVKQKNEVVKQFNSGKIKAFMISSSGGEGLDLKGTRQVHVMEPHWNEDKIGQVIGRSARYKSHDGLPPEQQNVTVYRYISALKKRDLPSADKVLEDVSIRKTTLNKHFLGRLNPMKATGWGIK